MKKKLEDKPDYAFVIVYRDRDPEILRRCLASIKEQKGKTFELILMDYGSNEENSRSVQGLLKMDVRYRYYYSDTRGLIWNQGSALNLAINQVLADDIIFVDSDLILPECFLKTVDQIYTSNQVFLYRAYYLNKTFDQYDQLFSLPDSFLNSLKISGDDANSWLIIHKKVIEEVNKYDEYFRIWGWQDVDFIRRCETYLGNKRQFINLSTLKVFHQWHPRGDMGFPTGWEHQSIKYLRDKKKLAITQSYHLKNCPPHQTIISVEDRPALQLYFQGNLKPGQQFEFDYPKIHAFNAFTHQWADLKSGDYLWVKQKFVYFEESTKSKLAKLINLINHLLAKIKVSYRMVDLKTYDTGLTSLQDIKDFIFYFILCQEQNHIRDYYFDIQEQELTLVMVKQ